jgi:hypothetical protein
MYNKVLGLMAAAALLGFIGAADAKEPVKLTDAQLDNATAGSLVGISTGRLAPGGPLLSVPRVGMINSMNGAAGILQTNQTTGENAVQQSSVVILGPGRF